MTPAERLDLIEWYLEQRWRVVPLHTPVGSGCSCGRSNCGRSAGKHPRIDDWPARASCATHVIREWWRTWPDANVGIVLGATSNNLADVDLDSPEALRWAPRVLPATLTFGRKSKPQSHWIYRVIDTALVTEQLSDVSAGGMLLELRSGGGGKETQTMFPPSIHPSGEEVEWTADPDAELAQLPAAELRDRVHDVAALCLVERHAGLEAAEQLHGGQWPTELKGPALARVRNLLGLSPAPVRAVASTEDRAYERARRYLQRLPPSISGSGGHDSLWRSAQALVRGFRLSAVEALSLLTSEFNPRCEPAWSEQELAHKVDDAINKSTLPWGYLLDAEKPSRRRCEHRELQRRACCC
jgi:Bifunctional DNA primase/polymerase, N-terminal